MLAVSGYLALPALCVAALIRNVGIFLVHFQSLEPSDPKLLKALAYRHRFTMLLPVALLAVGVGSLERNVRSAQSA